MTLELKGIIKNGVIELGSRSELVLAEHEGKGVIIEIDERESWEKRKFFEGAISQFFYYQHPYSNWKNFREAREALKLEFNGEWINDREGNQQRNGKSTKMSNAKFTEFLGKIQADFQENGLEFPDSEDYIRWIESAPDPDAVYPPLQKLIDKYKQELANPKPAWRR